MINDESRIEAEVQKRLTAIVAEQQKQFAATMEMVMKNSLGGLDQANADLVEERKRVADALDEAHDLRKKFEREGEKIAAEAQEKHSRQYDEAARTSLLRDLARRHIEVGEENWAIAHWLGVEEKFVQNIRVVVERVEKYRAENRPKRTIPSGHPKVRFQDFGRGGTVFFESSEAKFDMWWEMGRTALAIVDVPPPERWEARTGLPVERRDEILTFIGEEIVERQARGGSFILGEDVLSIYSN